ncbi:MAG: helix-turn-helix domain-containing protein [Pseudomonadota bacterium]|nr:helix-turn-helix domain-containing protein [Pseudomonadota bacterium]
MRWHDLGDERCPVARGIATIGDRWTLLVIRDCLLGVRRFEDFQTRLGIARRVLAERLALLVERGVLRKVPYSEKPLRHEYRLTRAGHELLPVILALTKWADAHVPHPDGPPLRHRHTGCDHVMSPTLTCSECGEPLDSHNVRAEPADPDSTLLAHARRPETATR